MIFWSLEDEMVDESRFCGQACMQSSDEHLSLYFYFHWIEREMSCLPNTQQMNRSLIFWKKQTNCNRIETVNWYTLFAQNHSSHEYTYACTHRNIHRPVETTKACLSKHRCHHRVCTQIRSAFVCVPIRKSGLDEFSLVRHTRFWCERYFDISIKLLDNRFLMKFNDRARIETSRSQRQWQYTSSNVQAQNG